MNAELASPQQTPRNIEELFEIFIKDIEGNSGQSGFNSSYYMGHRSRFIKTGDLIPKASAPKSIALETGATDLLQVALKNLFKYDTVVGTVFSDKIEEKRLIRKYEIGELKAENLTVSINLENEFLPFQDETVDLVVCAEVLEHMDVDPMFMLSEFNRVLKPGGTLIVTTPNSCSSRNFWKIAQGYRPHFFTQYEKSRSPYRHNFEYDVHAVAQIAASAGFSVDCLETHDVFEPAHEGGLELLQRCNLPTEHRGDGIFGRFMKTSGVLDRWPASLYV